MNEENRSSNVVREDSRPNSSISSFVEDLDMINPTETSSISTNGSNEEAPPNPVVEGDNKQSERWKRIQKKAEEIWNDLLEGLAETNEQIDAQKGNQAEERLSPRVMQSAISRCLSESHVYLETLAGIYDFFIWKNPIASLCTYVVLLYCLYQEIAVPIFLGLVLFQLALNYLESQKNIKVGLTFLPQRKLPRLKFEVSGIQLIFDVARRAQSLVSILADCFQKLRALFMWRQPQVTLRFVLFVGFFFCMSLVLSLNGYILFVGFLTVDKMFLMTYLYFRFPNTRRMFDIAYYFYRSTPIDPKKRLVPPTSVDNSLSAKKFPIGGFFSPNLVRHDTAPTIDVSGRSNASSKFSSFRRNSLNIFSFTSQGDDVSLSTENSDVVDEQDTGSIFKITRSCTFVDISLKSVPGTLILTDQRLEFRPNSVKNSLPTSVEMLFENIVRIKKINNPRLLSRLKPGSGKGLELEFGGNERYQFLGISKREDFYEILLEMVRLSVPEIVQN